MFDTLSIPDARPVALMKRLLPIPLGLFVISAACSGYRAYYQVRSLELRVADRVLRAAATGRPQRTRLPPPAVSETAVEIRRE